MVFFSVDTFDVAALPRIVFGAGRIKELAGLAASYGSRALLVTGRHSFQKSDHWRPLTESLKNHGICQRGSDGFLNFLDEEMSPNEYLEINTMMWRQLEEEGYLSGAVDTLKRAGYDAWVNAVNDVAILPSAGILA